MIDWTKPVETVKGARPVRVLATDIKGTHRIAVAVPGDTDADNEYVTVVMEDGKAFAMDSCPSIRNVRVKIHREGWANVYQSDSVACFHPTKAIADLAASPGRLACFHVVIEGYEGDGL